MTTKAPVARPIAAPWIPGWSSLRGLRPADVPREFAAGLSITAVAIPVGLALAALLGVPSIYGLYASIFPMIAYALFGPSRYLVVGPDTATCLLVASALTSLGLVAPDQRITAASALALIAGIGFGLASLARLGFVANLLSRPILVGYMGGVGLTLIVSQISAFTQVEIETRGLILSVAEIVRRGGEIHWPTFTLGTGLFVAMQGCRILAPRLPAAAIVVVAAILLSWGFDLKSQGIEVIGAIPSGVPNLVLPRVDGRLADMGIAAISLFVVAFVSGAVTARSFGQMLGVNNDANLELRGFAAANIAAGLFQSFPVTGADSRTAVNLSSGGRTALAPIAAGLFMIAIVAAFTAPLTLLPRAALGAVLLSAGIGLIDFKALRHLARVGPQELGFALVAMAGVIWVGVLQGVFLAILATFIYLLALVSRPRNSRMGWIPDETDMVPLDRYPTARLPEDGVVFIFEASLLFVNADYFRERAFAELDAMPQARWFVLDASGMPYADSTAIATLLDFREALRARGLHFSISGGHGRFWEILARAGAVTTFTEEEIHSTAAQAVDRVRARAALGPPGVVG